MAATEVGLLDLGRAPYGAVYALQQKLHAAVAAGQRGDTWIVAEHEPVITLGRQAKQANILLSADRLAELKVETFVIERGGDVTYHGPGQVVIYPIIRLVRFREIVPLVSALEHAVVDALLQFGIHASERREHRGVYVGERAICAVGLAIRRLTVMHGIALNVHIALDYDRLITPCGTREFGITSISHEIGRGVAWSAGRDALLAALQNTFNLRFVPGDATLADALTS